MADFDPEELMGEWVFSHLVYPPKSLESELEVYLDHIETHSHTIKNIRRERDKLSHTLREASVKARESLDEWAQRDWSQYDLIGFSTMFQQNMASLALAARIKNYYPGIPVVFGGANCEGTMGRELMRQFPFIDYVCIGEGERAFGNFLDKIRSGEPMPTCGILNQGDELLIAPQQPKSTAMGSCPLDFDDWIRSVQHHFPDQLQYTYWPLEASRGCCWGRSLNANFAV